MYVRTINSFDEDLNATDKVYDIRLKADGTWDLLHPGSPHSFDVPGAANSDGLFVVDLPEMPAKANTDGSNAAPDIQEPAVATYTLVATPADVLTSLDVYCDYRRAFLIFHADAASKTLEIDAFWLGSKFSATDLNNMWASLSGYANTNGDSSETFDVDSTSPSGDNAINKTYADATYHPKGGSASVIHDAASYEVSGTKVVGGQGAIIADCDSTVIDATYDADEQTVLNSVRTQLDLVLAALRTHGLIDT